MLVMESSESLVLKLDRPNRVLDTIPTATRHSDSVVIVPHKLDEVRVLNNLGIKAPSPVSHYYKWPGRFQPYAHQRATVEFLVQTRRGAVLNDIGTGKTQSALWAADYLIDQGLVNKVLILSPLSTLERVWADGIFNSLTNRTFAVLYGSAEKRRRLIQADHNFYILNHDGFRIVQDDLTDEFDLIIVDEAAVYRNPRTARYRRFAKFMASRPATTRLWLMTGTPTPNAPTDAFALAKLLGNPDCPRLFSSFRDRVMYKAGPWKWVPKPNASHSAHLILRPSVRYAREDCVDLPETVLQTREVDLTPAQHDAYQEMTEDLVLDLGKDGVIDAANQAVKLQKLLQICAGVVYDRDKNNIRIDCSNRIAVVKELIEQAGGKVIVFVPLTGALNVLAEELQTNFTTAIVNGSISAARRNVTFRDFQDSPDPRVLVAHPGTMAHGLTLTAASTIVWFIPTTSNETYTQANGRIERIGKTHSSNVIHISGSTLEDSMYDRLVSKQRMQGVLLNLIAKYGDRDVSKRYNREVRRVT